MPRDMVGPSIHVRSKKSILSARDRPVTMRAENRREEEAGNRTEHGGSPCSGAPGRSARWPLASAQHATAGTSVLALSPPACVG